MIRFEDLVATWRDKRLWSEAHPDLRQYYGRRYAAYAAAFDASLDDVPDPCPEMPRWMSEYLEEAAVSEVRLGRSAERWAESIHSLALHVDSVARRVEGPSGGYLEAPPEIAAAHSRFAPRFRAPVRQYQDRAREMIEEFLATVFPVAARREITAEDLREHGFDPDAPAPDPDMYW